MKVFSYILVFIATIYLIYGFSISQFNLKSISTTSERLSTDPYDYKGVINVHSQAGQGQGTVPEILKAAYEAQLDFVIFTESSSFEDKIPADRYEENLLVLNGREYSYLKSRLILLDPYFDFSQIKSAGDAHLFLSDYLEKSREGFVLLKHPTKEGFEWEGEFAQGIDAIEIISLRSHWRESWDRSKWNFITSLLMYPFNPEYAFLNIYKNPKLNLNLWNKISDSRPIIGLIGSDAKSKLKIFGDNYLRFPSYKQLFLLSSNHLLLNSELTGQLKADSEKVIYALSNGQFYFSLDFLGDTKGFNFTAIKDKKSYPMGQSLNAKNISLCLKKPYHTLSHTWAILYHNGRQVFKTNKNECFRVKDKGSYNIIYYRKIDRPWPFKSLKVPWIYSNFIYLK